MVFIVRVLRCTLLRALWDIRIIDSLVWDTHVRNSSVFALCSAGPLKDHIVMPVLFADDRGLQECLDREDYVLVLDRACVQFEPDDPDYIRVTSAAYDHVDAARLYERLQSTRHFGALAFYLAWHRRIDNLLLHFIQLEK